jgi:hypothetical protein
MSIVSHHGVHPTISTDIVTSQNTGNPGVRGFSQAEVRRTLHAVAGSVTSHGNHLRVVRQFIAFTDEQLPRIDGEMYDAAGV